MQLASNLFFVRIFYKRRSCIRYDNLYCDVAFSGVKKPLGPEMSFHITFSVVRFNESLGTCINRQRHLDNR